MCGCGCNNFRNMQGILANNDNSEMASNNSTLNNCGCQNNPRCGTNLSDDNWCSLLQNYIGRRCSCEFQLANNLVKRTGILNNVGTNFLVLASSNNCSNILLCDTSNLVFVKVE